MLPTLLPSIRQHLLKTPFEHIAKAGRDVLTMYGNGPTAEALLGGADRYYLLTIMLHRAAQPWRPARCGKSSTLVRQPEFL